MDDAGEKEDLALDNWMDRAARTDCKARIIIELVHLIRIVFSSEATKQGPDKDGHRSSKSALIVYRCAIPVEKANAWPVPRRGSQSFHLYPGLGASEVT